MKKLLQLAFLVLLPSLFVGCGSDDSTDPASGGETYQALFKISNLNLNSRFTQGPFGKSTQESVLYWDVRDRDGKFVDLPENQFFQIEPIMHMSTRSHGPKSVGPIEKLAGKGKYQVKIRFNMKGNWDLHFKIHDQKTNLNVEDILVKINITK